MDFKPKSFGKNIGLVIAGAVATAIATRVVSWSSNAAATLAKAEFVTTAAAAQAKSEIQDDYRGLINETRNIEADHYQALSRQLSTLANDVSGINQFLRAAERAPSAPSYHRGKLDK